MKIEVKKLKPNPFRRMDRYPMDPHKIDALKKSIQQTTFWDNLLAREGKRKGEYELAYGHHRLQALQELEIKEIDIPVRDLDDVTMIKIMANENLDQWEMSPAVINETVFVAKSFLDAELQKCNTISDLEKTELMNLLGLKGQENQFQSIKKRGVGTPTIHKFLGADLWKRTRIQHALEALKDEKLDREAYETFDNQAKAKDFQDAVKKIGIPKEKQAQVAKKVSEKLKETPPNKAKEVGAATATDRKRSMQEMVYEASSEDVDEQKAFFLTLENKIERFKKNIRNATGASNSLEIFMRESNINEIEGWEQFSVTDEVYSLLNSLELVMGYFGIEIKTRRNHEISE